MLITLFCSGNRSHGSFPVATPEVFSASKVVSINDQYFGPAAHVIPSGSLVMTSIPSMVVAGTPAFLNTDSNCIAKSSPSISPSCATMDNGIGMFSTLLRKAAEKRWPDAVMTNSGIVLALARIAPRETLRDRKR